MTDNRCVCPRCLHPSCPLPYAEPPYDEVAHEIDNNFISVKIPKNRGKFEPEGTQQQQDKSSFDFNCADSEGTLRLSFVLFFLYFVQYLFRGTRVRIRVG